jgi:N-methylhydantoinase A
MIAAGFDIGGTFTDLMMFEPSSGRWFAEKVRTTPDDEARACLVGLGLLVEQAGVGFRDVGYLAHGTTVATNTLVERRGAQTALLTTKGFRDVLEIRRQVMPHRYDVSVPKPEPLVGRRRRVEVEERTLADGRVESEIEEGALAALLEELSADGVDAVAISFLHAYANPENERVAQDVARAVADWSVTASHNVLNEHREYERTSTVIANAYLAPGLARYLESLGAGVRAAGIEAPLLVFQSNGGLAPAEHAAELPVSCLLSGPAAGVVAATAVARTRELSHFISLDMGGTSCDVTLVDDFSPSLAFESEISGWPIRTPRLDIHSVGAGGGSIAWIDGGGLLRVGPRSAGAAPGPACYGQGGTAATVTDAHVVLGRLGETTRLAGELALDVEAARTAVGTLAEELEYGLEEAAGGIVEIVNATMVRAIRLISLEHGHDPRKYSLIAFGGAGPLHACDLVRTMELRDAVIPPRPGLLCALGLLAADLRVDASTTRRLPLTDDVSTVSASLAQVESDLRASTAVQSRRELDWQASYAVDARYVGQSFDLTLPVAVERLEDLRAADIDAAFDRLHEATYGHSAPGAPKELMRFRVSLRAEGGVSIEQLPRVERHSSALSTVGERALYVRDMGWIQCPVFDREALVPGDVIAGPAIIEQMDTTIVVAPDFSGRVDESTNVVLTRTEVGRAP